MVKKIDPTKNTRPSTREPTSSTKPGSAATVKQDAPIANSAAVHHPTRAAPTSSIRCPPLDSSPCAAACVHPDRMTTPRMEARGFLQTACRAVARNPAHDVAMLILDVLTAHGHPVHAELELRET